MFGKRIISLIVIALMACVGAAYADQSIAEVNGKQLTVEQFQALINTLKLSLPENYQITEDDKEKLVDSWVKEELVVQEAVKKGLDKDKDIQYALDESKRQALAQIYLSKEVLSKLTASKKELQAFYDENKSKIKTADKIKVKDILIKSKDQADKVYAELKSGGDFDKLADKYSNDKDGAKGVYFQRGEMVPELERIAFSLKEGQVGGPVKTDAGYYIIKIAGIKAGGYQKFEDVEREIEMAVLKTKRQEAAVKFFDDIKSNANIILKKELLKDINVK